MALSSKKQEAKPLPNPEDKHRVFCAVLSGIIAKRGPASPNGDHRAYADALLRMAQMYADAWEENHGLPTP